MAFNTTVVNATGFMSAVIDYWLDHKHESLWLQRSPFYSMLAERGRIKGAGYGIMMREPVRVPTATGPKLTGVTQPWVATAFQPMTGFTWAQWPLSEYTMPIAWENYQAYQAGGATEMVNWIEAILDQGHDIAMNQMMDDLWAGPEVANAVGVRSQIMSLPMALNGGTASATDGGASPKAQASQVGKVPYVLTSGATAVTTVGGLPRAAVGAAYWCTPLVNGMPYGSTGSTPTTTRVINATYKQALQDGNQHPNLIIAPDQIEDSLQGLAQFGGTNGGTQFKPGGTLDLGYDYLQFRRARMIFDRRCPTNCFDSATSTSRGNLVFFLDVDKFRFLMRSRKPIFKEVVDATPTKKQFGEWNVALTAKNLGNCHAVAENWT